MRLTVNGVVKAPDQMHFSEMHLSSARANRVEHKFQIVLAITAVEQLLQSAYELWVAESKIDDQHHPSGLDELALSGYPSLAEVLRHQALVELVVGRYLLDDLMLKLFDFRQQAEPGDFWFDYISTIQIDQEQLVFEGICYQR